jgi:hypothetical protein
VIQINGRYNASSRSVYIFAFLQKSSRFDLETATPSPRETTARACAPRPKRREELRCTTRLLVSMARVDLAQTHADSGSGRAGCCCDLRARTHSRCRTARGMMRLDGEALRRRAPSVAVKFNDRRQIFVRAATFFSTVISFPALTPAGRLRRFPPPMASCGCSPAPQRGDLHYKNMVARGGVCLRRIWPWRNEYGPGCSGPQQ